MQPLIPYFPTIRFTIPLPDFFPMDALVMHGFGICLGIALIYGAIITLERAERQKLDYSTFRELFFWLVFGVIVGGHVGYGLFYYPEKYLANPRLFLDVSSGLSSLGGFITCAIAFTLVLRRRKQPLLPYADNIMYGFSFGWFFGRLGCTLNHEHPGTPTQFFLGRFCRPVDGYTLELPSWMVAQTPDLRFSHCIEQGKAAVTSYADKVSLDYPGVTAVHDMGLYEMLYALILFISYRILDKKPRPQGLFFLMMLYSYAPLRFMMDFLRPLEGNVRYSGLTPAQWGCLVFLLIFTSAVVYYREHFKVMPVKK